MFLVHTRRSLTRSLQPTSIADGLSKFYSDQWAMFIAGGWRILSSVGPLDGIGQTMEVVMLMNEIVVGTDGSSTSMRAVRTAAWLAATAGAHLHIASVALLQPQLARLSFVVTCIPPDYDDRARADAKRTTEIAASAIGGIVTVTSHVLGGDPADELVGLCRRINADILVLGHCGVTGPTTRLGRVARAAIDDAPCSVVIARDTILPSVTTASRHGCLQRPDRPDRDATAVPNSNGDRTWQPIGRRPHRPLHETA